MTFKQQGNYRTIVWRQFRKNKPALLAMYALALMLFVALFAPILANNRPLYVKYRGETFFPAFSTSNVIQVKNAFATETINADAADWKSMKTDKMVFPPITYSPGKSDFLNSGFVSPGGEQKFLSNGKIIPMPLRFRHWLGTGSRGDDLMAGLIHGTRISLTIGITAMIITSLIGIIMGVVAGFFGDDGIVITRGKFLLIITGLFFSWFYAFQLRSGIFNHAWYGEDGAYLIQVIISIFLSVVIVLFFAAIGNFLKKTPFLGNKILMPVDTILSRVMEIFVSLPLLVLIITLAAISKPSLMNVMIIIGLTQWTGIARLTRAEMLRIRKLEYIQSARALGARNLRIMINHALPNAITPAIVSMSFIVGNAILIESALSFIGIGVPPTMTTWGSLIAEGRENFNAWWMVILPGFSIMVTVLACNMLAEGLRDALDPRLNK
ncbi:MAG: ABC transporter permease [Chitinophagales bacterium]